MNANLTQYYELSKLNCEKQGLCDIVTKYLGALKGGRQMSSLFPKRNGVPVMETLRVLCMAKMLGDSLLKAYRQGFYGAGDAKRGKNSFYLFRSNPKINWREVMARVALRLKSFIIKNNMAETKAPHCFIIDDTAIVKTGLKMERASKIHDHTDGRYKLGYKLLACAYFDGKSTICPDFALLRESKRNNYGLSDGQLEKQHSKERDEKCPAHQRLSETDASKLSVASDMVKRLWDKGLRAEYVLTDSWFSCAKFIKEVRAACDGKAHLVCRAKFNATKYDVQGKVLNALQIRDLNRSEAVCCKKYKCMYIKQKAMLGDQVVLLFLVRFGNRDNWDILMTTDTSMSFVKCLEIYQIRWNIEVVFKECKQHLGLEDCQSRDFDSQIADISLCFLIHAILTLEKRINDYESFGGMFHVHRDALLQKTLWKRNLDMLSRSLSELAPVFGWCVTDAVVCASAMLAKLNELIFGQLQSKHILVPC